MIEIKFLFKVLASKTILFNKLEFIQALLTIHHTLNTYHATISLQTRIWFYFPMGTPHLQIISSCGTIFKHVDDFIQRVFNPLSSLFRVNVIGFGKTDHIVTIDISRNTNLKHWSRHGSLVPDCSHARFAV